MPGPFFHLYVAAQLERWLLHPRVGGKIWVRANFFDYDAFLWGSVAGDSYRFVNGLKKEATHWEIDRWATFPIVVGGIDKKEYAFAFGHFVHLLIDRYWYEKVKITTEEEIAALERYVWRKKGVRISKAYPIADLPRYYNWKKIGESIMNSRGDDPFAEAIEKSAREKFDLAEAKKQMVEYITSEPPAVDKRIVDMKKIKAAFKTHVRKGIMRKEIVYQLNHLD